MNPVLAKVTIEYPVVLSAEARDQNIDFSWVDQSSLFSHARD